MELPSALSSLMTVPTASVVVLLVLLVVSSFFSMSETVFSSLNVIRIRNYIEENRKGSKKAYWIHENFDLTLSTILVGNNLANVALATVSASVFSRVFAGQETLVMIFNTLVMTTIILIFGEIIPKSTAKMHADAIALKISGVLYVLIKVMKPITIVFIGIKKLFIKPDNRVTISVTEDELETIIDTMEEEGSIDEDEAEMLQSVLDLSQRKVYEIMTPRVDMIAVSIDDDLETVKALFFDNQFSRLPVYEGDRDNIVGILNERDFFTSIIKESKFDIQALMTTPVFVSKSMRADTLIETLQRENVHLAVVSDEFGGTSGIVTMEDALEELVGEIYDEHDDVEDDYVRVLSDNKYDINAEIDLDDLFEELNLGVPPTEEKTLGGWLFEQFESIPEVDMSYTMRQTIVTFNTSEDEPPRTVDITFIIREMKERRIKHVHMVVADVSPDDALQGEDA